MEEKRSFNEGAGNNQRSVQRMWGRYDLTGVSSGKVSHSLSGERPQKIISYVTNRNLCHLQ